MFGLVKVSEGKAVPAAGELTIEIIEETTE